MQPLRHRQRHVWQTPVPDGRLMLPHVSFLRLQEFGESGTLVEARIFAFDHSKIRKARRFNALDLRTTKLCATHAGITSK